MCGCFWNNNPETRDVGDWAVTLRCTLQRRTSNMHMYKKHRRNNSSKEQQRTPRTIYKSCSGCTLAKPSQPHELSKLITDRVSSKFWDNLGRETLRSQFLSCDTSLSQGHVVNFDLILRMDAMFFSF